MPDPTPADTALAHVLVFGASGGIGGALVERLTAAGHVVHAAGRRPEALAELAGRTGARAVALGDDGPQALERAVSEVAAAAQAEGGRLHGLVNCIGSLLLKPAHRTSWDEWSDVLRTNLDTAFATVRAGADALRKGGGSIVLMASAAAELGLRNHEAIAAAKAGVVGLAKAAAASYASRGIRVNVVAPGMVRTPLSAGLLANQASAEASTAMHPLGRLGEPDDVARAIAWLVDPGQSWVTGQVLGVDGGLASLRA